MITGAHAIIYTQDAQAARAFFRDVLGFPSADAGEGWLIFGLPPSELAAHPAEASDAGRHQLYLLCADIGKAVGRLRAQGVEFTGDPVDHGWGILTTMKIPGGGEIGLYEPRHPRPPVAKAAAARRTKKRPSPARPARKPRGRAPRRKRRGR